MRTPAELRLTSQTPSPGRFWVRYAPREWSGPEGAWTNLATAEPGESRAEISLSLDAACDDVLYLPPVSPELRSERDRLAEHHLAAGTPVLVQLLAGELQPAVEAVFVHDLLPSLLAGDLAALSSLPAGAAAVWPLLAGLTDEPALWKEGLGRLAAAGVAVAVPLALSLTPATARRLAEGHSEAAYVALFHRDCRPPRAFAAAAHRHGLAPWLPRPLPRPPLAGAGNKALAAALLLASELALDLDRSPEAALRWARAARWIDEAPYDVAALVREGNLGVVSEVDGESRQLAEEWVRRGRLALLDELRGEWMR